MRLGSCVVDAAAFTPSPSVTPCYETSQEKESSKNKEGKRGGGDVDFFSGAILVSHLLVRPSCVLADAFPRLTWDSHVQC